MPSSNAGTKNWECRHRGTQFNVRICPLCGDSHRHFYMNKESCQWECKKYQESGSLFQLEKNLGDIEEAIRRYGIQFVLFDNLHLICRSDRVNEQIAQATLSFKLLAEEMEIPVVVITQPRKRENTGTEIMSAEDVRYSSAVHSDCAQMIILHRNRTSSKAKDINAQKFVAKEESMDSVTVVRVEGHRYGSGGETLLILPSSPAGICLIGMHLEEEG